MPNFTDGLTKLDYMGIDNIPIHDVEFNGVRVSFFVLGQYSEFRIRTILTKEPETVNMLSTLLPSDCYWDIGANIGLYSLLAASTGANVISVEPSPSNFYLLMKNIELNKYENILALPIGLSDHNGMQIWSPNLEIAHADNQINDTSDKIKNNAGLIVRSIDSLISDDNISTPTHMKIDVDGIEDLILLGGQKILKNKKLRFIQVEVDESSPSAVEITKYITSLGFSDPITRHPPYYDNYYYAPIFNYFFSRS
ncbi:FkbM family methyltransferase [Candidatus Woesearchaeota archaeon]|jgi:FkbM family methyltransferase|nr:FkbM family methyltransferase [Candidatus Woesearchaeota archaeon]